MRAVGIMEVGKIQMVDIPIPEINEYECLVKMTHAASATVPILRACSIPISIKICPFHIFKVMRA